MAVFSKRAITVHTDPADITVSDWGKAWYWALTALFTIFGVLFLAVALTTRKKRLPIFCHLSALSCYVMSMGYFAMAADLGWVAVEVEFERGEWSALPGSHPTRQVFWIRYLMWLVGTPLLNTQLFLLVSAPIEVSLLDAFFIFVVMATGYGGAAIPTSYKWAYYFYGAIACAGIAFLIAHTGYKLASAQGRQMQRMYVLCSSTVGVLWTGYGLAWGLGEGGNVISPAWEGVFYGILDFMGGPVFGILVAFAACQCLCETGDGLQS